jgi:cobalt-zinc-cadmium efflux system outer membrane protein
MKAVVLVIVCSALLGCATFHNEPLSPSQTASEFEARTLRSEGLKTFVGKNTGGQVIAWPPKTWDLEMLTLAAFYYNPAMDVARAKWGMSRADLITAGEIPNPKAGFIPMYHANQRGLPPWTLTFALDIPLETAGRRGYRIAAARHLSRAAFLEINSTAWHVRSRLRRDFLSLFGLLQRKDLLEKRKLILSDIAELYRQRLAAGEASGFAVTASAVEFDKAALSLSRAEKDLAQARRNLAGAVGLPATAFSGIAISWDGMERPTASLYSSSVRREALLGRADILAELEKYEAAQSELRLEIAKQYPDIQLGPGYSWDQGDNEWSLGVSIILPVFNRNQGGIVRAEARRKEVAAQFRTLQYSIIEEIDAAYQGYEDALKNLKAADSILAGRHKQYEAMKIRFMAGQADRIALLNAELEVALSKVARLDALLAAQRSVGRLEDAVQRPLNREDGFPEKAVFREEVKR